MFPGSAFPVPFRAFLIGYFPSTLSYRVCPFSLVTGPTTSGSRHTPGQSRPVCPCTEWPVPSPPSVHFSPVSSHLFTLSPVPGVGPGARVRSFSRTPLDARSCDQTAQASLRLPLANPSPSPSSPWHQAIRRHMCPLPGLSSVTRTRAPSPRSDQTPAPVVPCVIQKHPYRGCPAWPVPGHQAIGRHMCPQR